jgi:lipopolysaccharide/colanic/teichoic acid biosynthesis glycosyltransferase
VVLSPLLLVIALAIRWRMGPPVLFRHLRPGHLGRPFELVKFRSMAPEVGSDGRTLPVNERVTPLGRLLRRTSLDELPELWNVLRGEMSLVGPRPLMLAYLDRYSPEQARRHLVRPGITGLAQVNGRHHLGWDERFELDVWYVDHRSMRLDLSILLATVRIALRGDSVPDPTAQEYEFLGPGRQGPAALSAPAATGAAAQPAPIPAAAPGSVQPRD